MMHWSSLGEFLAMGGYAVYVWGSLLMTALLLGGEQLLLARRRRAIQAGPRPAAEWRETGDE
ncbi:heme exporter protein CcmD [Achromobacter anxifer]|jgi:heme exporter protein D